MKLASRTKKILIVVSIAMAAGLIMAVVGFFTGARLNIVMGNHGVTISGGSGDKTLKTENGLKLDAFTSVEGKITDSNVRFVPSDHFSMDLAYYGQDNKPNVTVNDGTLQITQQTSEWNESWFQINFNVLNNQKSGEITVYYPKGIRLNKLNIDSDSGNLDAADFNAQSTDISCNYGSLTLKSASCGKCTLRLESGTGTLTSVNADGLNFRDTYGNCNLDSVVISGSEETAIDATNGKININNCKIPTLTLTDSYGNISLASLKTGRLNADLKHGSLSMADSTIADAHVENSYGNVNATGLALSGGEIRNKNGSITLQGLLKGKTTLHSDFGSVSAKTSLPQSQYRCDLATNYGSVSVNGKKYGKGVSMPINAKIRWILPQTAVISPPIFRLRRPVKRHSDWRNIYVEKQ